MDSLTEHISLTHVFLAVVLIAGCYAYRLLHFRRYELHDRTLEPPKSWLWGHMPLVAEEMGKTKVQGNHYSHPDYALHNIYKALPEQKGAVALDMWPMEYTMLFITSHKVAEQLSRSSKEFRYGVYKSPTMHGFDGLIGKDSMLTKNGEEWKTYRKLFNPGFAPTHLVTLLPQILDKTKTFLARLERLAESGEVFTFETLCTGVTFDIIGAVALGINLNAQADDERHHHPIVKAFRNLTRYFDFETMYKSPFQPSRYWRQYKASKSLESEVVAVIMNRWKELQAGDGKSDKSVLTLALKDLPSMDAKIATIAASQLRTFLFAGHDTTSTLLQYMVYQLSQNAEAREKFFAELDAVFGAENIIEALSRPDAGSKLQQLPYMSAIIKETLRLNPPAGAARRTPRGTGLKLRMDDDSEILGDEYVLYVSHHAVHRDPVVYPDPEAWKPERWLGQSDTSENAHGSSQLPASAWRPFERGPRNCIGQELANLEARVILACVARPFVFEKVGLGANGKPLVNKMEITSKPLDGMQMRVQVSAHLD